MYVIIKATEVKNMNMNILLAQTAGAEPTAAATALVIAFFVVVILLGVATVVAGILRIIIFFNYWVTDRSKTEAGFTGETAAKHMLEKLGYDDIEVKKAGFFRALVYSNHYNPKKKTVYLRASTFKRDNITSVGLALQKVGIVIQDKKGGSVKSYWRLKQIAVFGPIMFIPIVIVGIIIDLVTLLMTGGDFSGVGTLVCAILGIAYFIASFVLTIYTIKVEKRANGEALEIMQKYELFTDDEYDKIKKVFRVYILTYITDFIINLLQIIKLILRIAIEVLAASQDSGGN